MASPTATVRAAQMAIAVELERAGFELDEENDWFTSGAKTIFAVLADDRSVQRQRNGERVILRDYVC
jgi:hypothetical protein